MTELKPCPFCGGDGIIEDYEDEDGFLWYGVTCLDCASKGECMKTRDEAAERWNERVNECPN